LELFDIYQGKELPKNTSAVGIRLKFRSDRGNLKGKTVDQAVDRITTALQKQLKVQLRTEAKD
jgi:phenylalanyl-tRNA synthetase beta subunit